MRIERLLAATLFVVAQAVLATPKIEHWTTPAGAQVYFVAAAEIPMLDVRVVFNAGSACDGAKPGLASFTAGLMHEGAGELDTNAFHDALGATGASLGTGAMRDMAWVSLRTLSDPASADPALALMQSTIRNPRFDAAALERLREQALIGLKSEKESPDAMAERTFFAALYGDHPYGSPTAGTEDSVKAFTRADVIAFHQRYYVAANATVAIVGATDRAGAERIAAAVLRDVPAGEPAAPLPPVAPLAAAREAHVEFPATQSHVWIGQTGLKRGDPDYFALIVGNHVLGGNGLVSILADEIREKRGLSYSAQSQFEPLAEAGPFLASLQTKASQEAEALKVLRATLAKFVAEGPSEKALAAAKQNLVGGFPLRLDGNGKIIEYLAMIGFYHLPLDYLDTFTERVAKITVDDVRDAFRRRVDPARMVTVTVGKQSGTR
ncbi:MAG: insulinase family protein [Gammaproteobacteria bacterium]|nr:insulinase family protein [Gammaproteobacteria bacterium]